MSPLRLNGSTSGYSQIDAPAVAGDQLFTLPGTGGTLDRLNRAGNILQVVQGFTSTEVIITTTTYTDTGLTATITPTSATSKILVLVDQSMYATRSAASPAAEKRLLRDSTVIYAPSGQELNITATGSNPTTIYSRQPLIYLDSPSTTSAVIYKTQGRVTYSTSSPSVGFQPLSDSRQASSFITLLEVAA